MPAPHSSVPTGTTGGSTVPRSQARGRHHRRDGPTPDTVDPPVMPVEQKNERGAMTAVGVAIDLSNPFSTALPYVGDKILKL